MSNTQRKWVSIIGGGLFGFGMAQVLILIITNSVEIQSPGTLVFTIVGLFAVSTFCGSVLAGVIDKDEADIRGIQAMLVAWVVYLIFDLFILLFVGLHELYVIVDLYVIFMVLIPILILGYIGGKIGGILRFRQGNQKTK